MKLSKLFIVIYLLVSFFFCCEIGFAEEGKKFDYSKSNLASFGVPDWTGLEPYKQYLHSRTSKFPGKETEISKYKFGNAILMISKYKGKIYGIGFDIDGRRPLDFDLVDYDGNSQFIQVKSGSLFRFPDWMLNDLPH